MTFPQWLKKDWREAAILALAAAFVLELAINVFSAKTVWHRLSALEHSVQMLEHEREMEEQRTRLQLEDLQEKSQKNTEMVEKVEEKVEKKAPIKH